jgi:hypothetical protein
VITGRGPGAPGGTSGVEFARERVAPGNPANGAVDLGEIRRSEEIIGALGARAAMSAPLLRDPAVALLRALAADADGRDAAADQPPGGTPNPASPRAVPVGSFLSPVRAPAVAWTMAAAAGAVGAGIAGSTGVVATDMLARLARSQASLVRGPASLARGPASRPRRSSRPWGVPMRPPRSR